MTRLLMLVEGQSEETFVKTTLAPFLAERGVHVERPVVLWTKRVASGGGFQGGVSHWNQIRRDLLPLTRDGDAWVTTLIDFYGLPDDFPGRADALALDGPRAQVEKLEEQFRQAITQPRFIPFLALHEFEAWIFCAAQAVADHFGDPRLIPRVQDVVQMAGEPEFINQGKETHPKARLRKLVGEYKEASDGPTLMGKIGIPAIKNACPHFAAWMGRLESLGGSA